MQKLKKVLMEKILLNENLWKISTFRLLKISVCKSCISFFKYLHMIIMNDLTSNKSWIFLM